MKFLSKVIFAVSVFVLTAGAVRAAGCEASVGKDFTGIPLSKSKLSASALLKLNQEIDSGGYDVRSLLILQGCQLVFERYKKGVDRDDTHFLYGGTTVITGALVGRLLKEGKIASLDAPLASLIKRPLFVADADWEKLQTIRLADAMRQRSGLGWEIDSRGGHPVHIGTADMLRDGVKLPLIEKPGTKYKNSDYDNALVGFAVVDVTGKDLPAAAQSLLYAPLQIVSDEWDFRDRMGRHSGGFGARLRPMDLLKIGQLYLQAGSWNGAQLLGDDFVKLAMPMTGMHEAGVSLMWVKGKNPDIGDTRFFLMNGRKTQRLYVFPDWEMVVVLTASVAPEDDQKIARPLVAGLKAALEKVAGEEEAMAKLDQLVRAGFNGTRTAAEPRDTPRKAVTP